MILALVLAATIDVLHAEPPKDSPVLRFPATARVEVDVDASGAVTHAEVLEPRSPFATHLSEAAARRWRFAPADSVDTRRYVLTFVYEGVAETEEPSRRVVTFAKDDLTLRVRYLHSTIERLERDENGGIAEQFCSVHHVPMKIDIVPIHYGLPSADADGHPRARERLFPQANLFAGGGCTVRRETHAERRYCEVCRAARSAWLSEHPEFARVE